MQWVLGSLLFCLAWPDGERYMSRACFAHMFCVQVTMETRVDDGYVGYSSKVKTQCHRHDLKMSRNGNCDAKHHGNASAGTMVRLKLVFAARICLQAVLDLFCMSTLYQTYLKKPNEGWSRTRSERGLNEVPNEVKNYPGQTLTQIRDRPKQIRRTNPKNKTNTRPRHAQRNQRAPHVTHSSKSKDLQRQHT